ISLTGFNAGTNNTVSVTADATHAAPDLDWIEIVNTSSSVPDTGLCQSSLWNVTSSTNSGSASLAVDSNLTNRWSTNRAMQAGDYFQIDFTGTVNLSSLTLDNTQDGSTNDFPPQYALYSSQDGVNFSSTPFYTGSGTATQTVATFPQESLRAVRVQVTTANAANWWSIGEIETNCSL
ncbi:MAG TPA: discoidin domain-containing protein, partial [Polyangia bacterium]|nr:discoidin domain-containing protein [Polyangia bacterium]